MHLAHECSPYLMGEMFSDELQVSFNYEPNDWKHLPRTDVLRELCRGKRIIHVGCVDHDIPTITKRLKRGEWLHKILCDSAERCYGVDIAEEGIRYIKETLGYSDVAAVDIAHGDVGALLDERWDCLVVPEVLEHANDPVDFLRRIHARFRSHAEKVILTVPNALSWWNFKKAIKGVEYINSDHRYWFTPYTLSKIVTVAGFRIEQIVMCTHGPVKRRAFVKNYFYAKHPLMRNDIVTVVRFGNP